VRRRDREAPVADTRSFHTQAAGDARMLDAAVLRAKAAPSNVGPALRIDDVVAIRKRDLSAPFPDRIGIGRAPNTDVCIPLPRISKYHAFMVPHARRITVCDARSTFGTQVNERALEPLQPKELSDGDSISFASYQFRFHTAEGFREYLERMSEKNR
jgi:pSer/pThr/pTyr-binding forkhead associated (FHA) protein